MATVTYKCPTCDAELTFDPERQAFRCDYCGSRFSEQEMARMEPQEESAEQTAPDEPDAVVYTCPSCGAEVMTDDSTAATFCFCCHNPVVLSGRLGGSLKPDQVLPFAFDREEAVARFRSWVRKKKFLPRAFFSEEQIQKLSGVYYPYWLTDCTLQVNMEADARNVRTWRTGNIRYTETSFYRVSRAGSVQFADLAKNALKNSNAALVEAVQPFDRKKMRPFTMAYLSGFLAEKRDIEHKELESGIAAETKGYAQTLLRENVRGYTAVNVRDFRANVADMKARYALLPVWVLTYRHKETLYYYVMNGQTGKVCGRLPVSFGKLSALFGAVSSLLLLLTLLGGYLL